MRFKLLAVSIILILVCSLVPPSRQVSASSFEVNYTLTLEQEDYPEVTVRVQGYPDQSAEFVFLGPSIINASPLDSIFQKMEVKDLAGNNLSWQWADRGISVSNGSVRDFTIIYSINAIDYQWKKTISLNVNPKCVLFRFGRISFVAGDVFLTPELEPEKITVESSLPEGTTLYASLPSENGTFQAVRDQWGNLPVDFSLAYFTGGQALFTLNHTTDWGDEYQYIWFDLDHLSEAWTPWYGNTPWEQAELYMETTESCARYFRDTVGPLPNHRILFSNTIEMYNIFPSVASGQDWFHYMQIWPRYSETDVCHHVFHQYSNNQNKLSFGDDSFGQMFSEGLNAYYEQTLLSPLFEDPRSNGKLFEFYVLDVRGMPFGIRGNNMHVKYNVSALKVYLLDQYIRSVTDGKDSLDDFVKAMWEKVKEYPQWQKISQDDIVYSFASVVGSENAGYLDQVTNRDSFDLQELSDLRSPFSEYADWMIHEYFWDKPILFYMFLDIVIARGNEWPHWATDPHNVDDYGRQALQPVWDYLSAYSGNPITRQDILDAMNASTHLDHAGFFEFWESLGITLDPNEIADLTNWDPQSRTLEDLMPAPYKSVGSLRTEHLLAGIPQKATIHLDAPAPTDTIFIGFKYFEEGLNLNSNELENVIQGDNVSVLESWNEPYEKFNMITVIFEIRTDDPNHQEFPIALTYPDVKGVSRFGVSVDAPKGDLIGDLYYLGPIQPISFELDNQNNEVILPDTTLEDETFFVSSDGESIQYKPGDTIQLSLASGPVEVQLFDKYGFIRGMNTATLINLPPTANFEFKISDTDTQTTMQFTDTSSDPDGQITQWLWDFGDGKTSNEKDPLYTYSTAGNYSVSLTVLDDFSESDTQVEQITVGGNLQNLPQNNALKLKLLLIISGILLVGGSVTIYFIFQKKKKKNHQIGIVFLGVVGILALVLGLFYEKVFISTPNDINSASSETSPVLTEMPVITTYEPTVTISAASDLPTTLDGDASGMETITETATPNNKLPGTKDGMTMLFVPEGEFTMGSDVTTDEQPIHTVYLDSFWIDQTEVTNAMYAQCVTEGVCSEPYDSSSSTQNDYYGNSTFNNYPVIYVDWFQAKTYCEWAGRNLPTEAQWEKATLGTDKRIYPWGNESPTCDLANKPGCKEDTTAVGSYPAGMSPYGVVDMGGNVWEWVSDWYGTYPAETLSNPQGPSSGEYRVMRGGSWRGGAWFDVKDDFRSALRGGIPPLSNDNFIGFRCALSAE